MASGSITSPTTSASFKIRSATLADTPAMGLIASKTYFRTPIDTLLSPFSTEYPADHTRGYVQRITLRMLNPRNLSIVAYPTAGSLNQPIAYAQFVRLGTDSAAISYLRSRDSIWLTLKRWYHKLSFKLRNWVFPDRSADPKAVEWFDAAVEQEDEKYWGADAYPERAERWQGQSVVVSKEWQGKGVGSAMMKEVLRRAQEENVLVGITATEQGELLYRKLGFRLVARFMNPIEPPDCGGHMVWVPEGRQIDLRNDK